MGEGWIVLGGVSALVFGVLALVAWADAREWGGVGVWRRRAILRRGTAASALILDELTKSSLFGSGKVVMFRSEIILEVQPPGGEPYQAVTRMSRTMGEGLYVAKGKTVPVRIGADGTVLIDIEAARRARNESESVHERSFEERVKQIERRRH